VLKWVILAASVEFLVGWKITATRNAQLFLNRKSKFIPKGIEIYPQGNPERYLLYAISLS